MYKPSNNPQIEELTKSIKSRYVKLEKVKRLQVNGKWVCVWCLEAEIPKNWKYCSEPCKMSAWAWASPQHENGLFFLLLKQDFKCNHCAFDYNPFLEEILKGHPTYSLDKYEGLFTIAWWIKQAVATKAPDYSPEVDHIHPIFKGGQSIGLDNHQVICKACHLKKSSQERRKGA